MKRTIIPGARTGRVRIPASKSQAHRLLICAALGEEKTEVVCDGISADIAATAKCLSALGAKIEEMETGFLVSPIKKVPEGRCDLYCGESGSTLRFLLPIVGALGAQAVFHREGRLPQRPLAPLDSVLKEHGMTLREDGDLLYCSGQLIGGNYTIAGNVSSQYISGLLMALPLLIRDSLLMVSGPLESAAYVAMTEDALQLSKLTIPKMEAMWAIPGQQRCHLPKRTVVEGDWSNTAFFLCMGALSKEGVTVEGLNLQSSQGDRGVLDVLRRFGAEVTEHGDAVTVRRGTLHGVTIDAAPIPDLIPVLSVVASVAEGETRVENAYRLRLKESDRLKSTADLLRALGGRVEEKEDGLVITSCIDIFLNRIIQFIILIKYSDKMWMRLLRNKHQCSTKKRDYDQEQKCNLYIDQQCHDPGKKNHDRCSCQKADTHHICHLHVRNIRRHSCNQT